LSGYTLLMFHKQQQIILMQSSVQELAYALLIKTLCLYPDSFCTTGDSRCLAPRETLAWVSRRRLWVQLLIHFCIIECDCLDYILYGTSCTYQWNKKITRGGKMWHVFFKYNLVSDNHCQNKKKDREVVWRKCA
jgi:hypothetical protein